MVSDTNSKNIIKSHLESIRRQRKRTEFDRTKSVRRQYSAELSVVRDALNSSVSGVIICDLDGNIRYVNNTFLRLFEYGGKAEIYGKNAADLFVSDKVKSFADVKAIIDRASEDVVEFEVFRRDETSFPVEVSASYVTDSEGNVVGRMSSFADITKRKQAEEEKRKLEVRLHETQRLEAIGTLAGGIAHEFHNVLQGIMGNLELLQEDFGHYSGVKKYVERLEVHAQRLLQLTRQLLAFAKGGKYQVKRVAANQLIAEILELIRHSIKPGIQILTEFNNDMHAIEVDAIQFKMVISAVVLNAVEAIENTGRIIIRTHNFEIVGKSGRGADGQNPDRYICVEIEDSGGGMDESILKRIFDPFFTTKFQGRGLGMAAAHGIIENHGGWIEVVSHPGQGTLVKIYLPAAADLK